jgi:hypothetical protein
MAINGKVVGGMTQVGVELELETSGPSLLLVVSRYKHNIDVAEKFAASEREMLKVMDNAAKDNRLMGWREVGNGPPQPEPVSITNLSEEEEEDGSGDKEQSKDAVDDDHHVPNEDDYRMDRKASNECDHDELHDNIESSTTTATTIILQPQLVHDRTQVARNEDSFSSGSESSPPRPCRLQQQMESPSEEEKPTSDDASNQDWEEDENAWLGCVCGKIHSKSRTGVFWIQCEACKSWYDVSVGCVGFTEAEAKAIQNWTCWACPEGKVEATPSLLSPSRTETKDIDTNESEEIEETEGSQKDISPKSREEHTEDGVVNSQDVTNQEQARLKLDEEGDQPTVSLRSTPPTQKERSPISKEEQPENGTVNSPEVVNQEQDEFKVDEEDGQPTLSRKSDLTSPTQKNRSPTSKEEQSENGTVKSPKMANQEHQFLKLVQESNHPTGSSRGGTTSHTHAAVQSQSKNGTITRRKKIEAPQPRKRKDGSFSRPTGRSPSGYDWGATRGICAPNFLPKGTLVNVKPHSWSRRNCLGGIGRVIDVYEDDCGDCFYDVKYVVGSFREHNIMAEYVSKHEF